MIKRTDANQKEIVDRLRTLSNVSVYSTHTIGKGFPDIIVGYKGKNYMIEIKDGKKPASQRKLTADELVFHMKWKGQIATCKTFEEVLEIIYETNY